jgi:hypothetical protein
MNRSASTIALSLVAALSFAGVAHADSSVPCSYFRSLPDSALRLVQVQIACLDARAPALCLAIAGTTPDPGLIAAHAHRRPSTFAPTSVACTVTFDQIRSLLDSLSAASPSPEVEADSLGTITFVMLDTLGGEPHLFESVLDGRNGLELVDRAFAVLKGNAGAAQVLALIGCSLAGVEREEGEEVTTRALVTISALSFDPSRREVSGTLRVVNHSSAPIPGPLYVVIEPRPHSVRLADADGFCCGVFAPGSSYVALPVEGSLAPGAAVEKRLRLDNPRQESFEIRRRVFSGFVER